jgi:macrolide transport system ATP-binding/permease protein
MKRFFRKLKWLTEGLANGEARCTARRELGNLARLQEDTRAAWGWTVWEQLGQDLRYAFRTMAADRLFSLLAIVSLALGIGANTAIQRGTSNVHRRFLPPCLTPPIARP